MLVTFFEDRLDRRCVHEGHFGNELVLIESFRLPLRGGSVVFCGSLSHAVTLVRSGAHASLLRNSDDKLLRTDSLLSS